MLKSKVTCFTCVQVATLGKSGVSVGYYDTEMNAARAYDRAAIGLLGRDNCSITTNFPLQEYDEEVVPQLIGKTREEVKATLKNERAKVSPHDLRCPVRESPCCLMATFVHKLFSGIPLAGSSSFLDVGTCKQRRADTTNACGC